MTAPSGTGSVVVDDLVWRPGRRAVRGVTGHKEREPVARAGVKVVAKILTVRVDKRLAQRGPATLLDVAVEKRKRLRLRAIERWQRVARRAGGEHWQCKVISDRPGRTPPPQGARYTYVDRVATPEQDFFSTGLANLVEVSLMSD